MSTIASPRRLPSDTPNSSTRPSLDIQSRSSTLTSPINSTAPTQPPPGNSSKKVNRAALREYYKLRAPRIEGPDSEVESSDLDQQDFNVDEYVKHVTATNGLADLLRLYTKVMGEVRALDAEKKALVYDNYNKLITATDTIRKMRATMDPLNPMASTLDPAMSQIYTQASSIRDALRQSVPPPGSEAGERREAEARRRRTKALAAEVLATPEKLRILVREGKLAAAQKQWQMPRELLEVWKEKGLGGEDVVTCLEEGDAALQATHTNSSKTSQDRPS